MNLLDRIEKHLKETHMAPSRFGRRAVGDPRFVLDLRDGRRPRARTLAKVENYLQEEPVSRSEKDIYRVDGK